MILDIYVNFQQCTPTVFLVGKFTRLIVRPRTSSAPSDGRAFALLTAIEPFSGKIFHAPRHVAPHVASSPSMLAVDPCADFQVLFELFWIRKIKIC